MTVASACTQDCRRRVRERACRGPVALWSSQVWDGKRAPHILHWPPFGNGDVFKHSEKKTQTSPSPDPLL